MNTTLLFAQADVKVIRKIATSFDGDTFNTFALEVQRNYLPKLLGPSLYNDLLVDPSSVNNVRLLNGEVYTNNENQQILYEGLKTYLAYLWLYTFAREGNLKFAEVGISQYQDDDSERAGNRSDQDTKKQMGKNANFLGRETIDFLTDNKNDFPLFIPEKQIQPRIIEWSVIGNNVGKFANNKGFEQREIRGYNFREIDINKC